MKLLFNLIFGTLFLIFMALLVKPKKAKPLIGFIENIKKYKDDFVKEEIPEYSQIQARDGIDLYYRKYKSLIENKNAIAILVHGSSANSLSLHLLAKALAGSDIESYSLDVRGHGLSGERGDIKYVGQLENDLEDFVKKIKTQKENLNKKIVLIGFSSGGGFVLRVASQDKYAKYFDEFISVSPMISPNAPTYRENSGGWASPSVPRIVAIMFLNKIGIKIFNHLEVLRFALDRESIENGNSVDVYSYNLQQNFGLNFDYKKDIKNISKETFILVGSKDEMFYADKFAPMFKELNPGIKVSVIDGFSHIDMSLNIKAIKEILDLIN